MRKRITIATLVLSLGLAPTVTHAAATLAAGDMAPPIASGEWVKGEPVPALVVGKIYVVEFWATWCGPCKATIPHLTEMSKKFPDVTFIGQDVFEDDDTLVRPFVADMGDKMAYRVALDDKSKIKDGGMSQTWMKAAGQNGIPTAFLVDKDGRIAWIGHPMALEPVLADVVAGKFDAKTAAAEREKLDGLQRQAVAAASAGDVDALLRSTAALKSLRPTLVDRLTLFEFTELLRHQRSDDARNRAKTLLDGCQDPTLLNSAAWTIAAMPTPAAADVDLAKQLAARASTLTNGTEPQVMDTLARLHAMSGDWKRAVDLQGKAVSISGKATEKLQLQKSLDAYVRKELPPAG